MRRALPNASFSPAPAGAARLRRGAAALLALPLLAGCETVVDVPEPEHTPSLALMLTLDNLHPADSMRRSELAGRRPFVSVSQRVYDMRQLLGTNQATIEVHDDADRVVERYRPVPQPQATPSPFLFGNYRPTLRYRFLPGSTYVVRAAAPGVEPVESRLTMPTEVPVQISATPLTSTSGQSRLRITVAFDDPAAAGDYYLATARIVDDQGRQRGSLQPVQEDSGFDVSSYRISGGGTYNLNAFSDANVNGQRVSFSNTMEYFSGGVGGGPAVYLEVTLSHLTRDLYLFYTSYQRYSDSNGNPFAEPSPLYSNVTPGFGIFGGSTDASSRVRL